MNSYPVDVRHLGRRQLPQGILIDTGAGVTIADGPNHFPEFKIEPSVASRAGQTYMGPRQEVIHNRGEVKTRLRLGAPEGTAVGMKFQDAKVRRPILSVGESTEVDNSFWFDNQGSFILPKGCPETIAIRKLVQQARQKLAMTKELSLIHI